MMMNKGNKSLFGAIIECECGRTHRIDPQEVYYGEDIFRLLGNTISKYSSSKSTAAVMDKRTRIAAGKRVVEELVNDGYDVKDIVIADPGLGKDPVCDRSTMNAVIETAGDAGCIIAVGSGVINDISKWAACEKSLPYICVATAASMNGYASANIAATINGVKTIVDGRPPKAILSAPSILCKAPFYMTASGLGDVLAKSVSSADWKLNSLMFGDYYCERSNDVIVDIENTVIESAEKIGNSDHEAVSQLFNALLLTGVAMTMAGNSAPASGGEHLISHALDMMSAVEGIPHDMHGRQVGIGTILASELYRRVFAIENPRIVKRRKQNDPEFWGRLNDDVNRHFNNKLERLNLSEAIISDFERWKNIKKQIRPFLRPPELIRECLKQAKGAYRATDIKCSPERLTSALIHAREIRSRFTILDLAYITGVLPDQAGDVINLLNVV